MATFDFFATASDDFDAALTTLDARGGRPRKKSALIDGRVYERRLISKRSEIDSLLRGIDACLEHFKYGTSERTFIRLCATEGLVNAVVHGNRERTDKEVRVDCCVNQDRFWMRIEDEGRGFRPDDVPDPTLPENLSRPSGRGVFLMRTYMDYVRYAGRGNVVELHRRRRGDRPEN